MTDIELDPWAWAHEEARDEPLDPSGQETTLIVVTHDGESWLPDLVSALGRLTHRPQAVWAIDAGSTDRTPAILEEARGRGLVDEVRTVAATTFGGAVHEALAAGTPDTMWIWFLHDDAVPAPDALEKLILRGREEPAPAAVVPLLLAPRRHGVGILISELGETVSTSGTVMSAETSGVIDQGQLESRRVLAASTCGLLIRTRAWSEATGLAADLPTSVQGLDLGARLSRAGLTLVTEPKARIQHLGASVRGLRAGADTDPGVERRAYGMSFDALLRGRRGATLPTALASGTRALGLLLGKDLDGLADEREAFALWRTWGPRRAAAAARFAALPKSRIGALRPTRRDAIRRTVDDLGARAAEWAATAADRRGDPGLDELTGDDFSGSAIEGRRRRWPTWVLTTVVLLVLAGVAARDLFILAPLRGPQLLPAPGTWTGALHAYLDPVAGLADGIGAPWSGLVWLASLPLLGWTDALVSVFVLGCVPLTFLVARRLVAALSGDRVVAGLGGLALALAPVLVGATGSGQVGAVVSYLLFLASAGQLFHLWRFGQTWGGAARLGLTLLALTAFVPLLGAALWLVTAAVSLTRPGRTRALVALAAPLLVFLSPWTLVLVSHPGRLLTGIDPVLAPQTVTPWWNLLLARPSVELLPPWWVSVGVMGLWWALALVAAVRRPRTSGWAFAGAAGFALVATAVSRAGVTLPPDGVGVPQATEWVLAMMASLVIAAALGFRGLAQRVRDQAFGVRQVAVAGAALVVAASLGLGTVWWVGWSQGPLDRRDVGAVPPFILNDSARGLTRTLTLAEVDGSVTWSVQEGSLPRLGDAERGIVFSGDARMLELATSVAERIVAGTSDDDLVADLQTLGVGYLWIQGGSGTLWTDLANTPGLGAGAVDGDTATWVVPDGGRVQAWTDDTLTRLDPEEPVPAGAPGRTLVLAEPGDPRWGASVGDQELAVVDVGAAGPTFDLGDRSGTLVYSLRSGTPWWAWIQAVGVALLLVAAAPGIRAERPVARVGRRGV